MRPLYLFVFLCFSAVHALAGNDPLTHQKKAQPKDVIEAPPLGDDDPLAHLKKGQPKDVIELIDRLVGCNHWSGEDAYDAERGQEIASALGDLKCERLEKDEAAVRRRYANRPSTLKVMQKAKDTTY